MKIGKRFCEVAAILAAALILAGAVWLLAADLGRDEAHREGTLVYFESGEARPAFHTRPLVRFEGFESPAWSGRGL